MSICLKSIISRNDNVHYVGKILWGSMSFRVKELAGFLGAAAPMRDVGCPHFSLKDRETKGYSRVRPEKGLKLT